MIFLFSLILFYFLVEGFTGWELEAFPVFANKTASLSAERWMRNLRNVGALPGAALEFLLELPLNALKAVAVLHIPACCKQRKRGTQQLFCSKLKNKKERKLGPAVAEQKEGNIKLVFYIESVGKN